MSEFPAQFNDGRTAKTHLVRPVISGEVLVIRGEDGAVMETWPGESIRLVGGRKGPGPVILGGGEIALARLTFGDRRVLEALLAAFPHIARSHRPDRKTVRQVGFYGALAATAVVMLIYVVIPALASYVAGAIPDEVQVRAGERIADQFTRALAYKEGRSVESMACNAPAGRAALDALVRRLGGDTQRYRVRVVDSKMVNALAMPGGVILIPRGMIGFAGSPEALAGVLGHEMGHVKHRHPTKNALEVAGVSLLFSYMVGDVAGGTLLVTLGNFAISGSYSRAAEREADSFAVARMAAAGMDARPMAAMFDKLVKMEKGGINLPKIMASHPPSAERATAIRRAPAGRTPALSAAQWRDLKAICGK